MIEDKDLGLKIAENPREALINESIETAEKSILDLELTLELKRNALKFLKELAETFKQ